MRLLGIDYGTKKVGLAFGDTETKIAIPLEIMINNDELLDRLVIHIEAEGYDQVIVGVPLATGAHHSSTQLKKTRNFIEQLKEKVQIPVSEEDESYTTGESIRLQEEAGRHNTAPEDAIAAMLILQAWMETNS